MSSQAFDYQNLFQVFADQVLVSDQALTFNCAAHVSKTKVREGHNCITIEEGLIHENNEDKEDPTVSIKLRLPWYAEFHLREIVFKTRIQ